MDNESPLEVLSRAAVMLGNNTLPPPPYEEAQNLTLHKRQFDSVGCPDNLAVKVKKERVSDDEEAQPLDMSKKEAKEEMRGDLMEKRGAPPSYFQSILSSRYVLRGRIQPESPAAVVVAATETKTDISSPKKKLSTTTSHSVLCDDPVIDEHFRRSLGKDYGSLFCSANSTNAQSKEIPSSLSVDDHFAKALGDTWLKLKQSEK